MMNADGTAQTRVTTAPGIDYQPAWSPDGTKILFTSRRNGGQDDIYVINPDGTGETRLTSNSLVEMGPAWSADGTKIVYTTDQGSNYEVYTMNADGSIADHDIAAQCLSVFQNLRFILEDAGAQWNDIVDVTVFLTDMKRDFPIFNKLYAEHFAGEGKPNPTRTTVEVTALPTPIAIELKVIAGVQRLTAL